MSSFSNCAYYAEVFFLYALRFFRLIHQILSAMQEKKKREEKSVRQELCKKGRNKRKHCEMQFFPALKFILLKGAVQENVRIFYPQFKFRVQFSWEIPTFMIEFNFASFSRHFTVNLVQKKHSLTLFSSFIKCACFQGIIFGLRIMSTGFWFCRFAKSQNQMSSEVESKCNSGLLCNRTFKWAN